MHALASPAVRSTTPPLAMIPHHLLDAIDQPAATVHADGRLVRFNRPACVLRETHELPRFDERRRLWWPTRSGWSRLDDVLQQALDRGHAEAALDAVAGRWCRLVVSRLGGVAPGAEPLLLAALSARPVAGAPGRSGPPPFTRAEEKVAQWLMAGLPPKRIADRLAVQPSTVRTHLQRLFEKTGTHRQAELVSWLLARARC